MLKNKSALVTGSTSGIGLGIVRALSRAGVNVMLNGFGDADAIGRLCRELADAGGGRVAYHAADVRSAAEVAALVAATEQAF